MEFKSLHVQRFVLHMLTTLLRTAYYYFVLVAIENQHT
jgi:hypothetical protein